LITDDETRTAKLTKRFGLILENQINYQAIDSNIIQSESNLIKTKFNSEKNYLWGRCSYFEENCDKFYISQIFAIDNIISKPNQLFIEKTNKVIFVVF
jgi:hypothetical protein